MARITISEKTKRQLDEFRNKGESYDDVIIWLLESAKKRQLQDILMDERGTIPISEALEQAKKRWS